MRKKIVVMSVGMLVGLLMLSVNVLAEQRIKSVKAINPSGGGTVWGTAVWGKDDWGRAGTWRPSSFCPLSGKQIRGQNNVELKNYRKVYFEFSQPHYIIPYQGDSIVGIGIDKDVIITEEHYPILIQYLINGVIWDTRNKPQKNQKNALRGYKELTIKGVAK